MVLMNLIKKRRANLSKMCESLRLTHFQIKKMSTLKQARAEAKARGLHGYSTMTLDQVRQLLRGEKVLKYKKNQQSMGSQTDVLECENCALRTHVSHLTKQSKPADKHQRKIVIDGDMEIDGNTGEVLGICVETSYKGLYSSQIF